MTPEVDELIITDVTPYLPAQLRDLPLQPHPSKSQHLLLQVSITLRNTENQQSSEKPLSATQLHDAPIQNVWQATAQLPASLCNDPRPLPPRPIHRDPSIIECTHGHALYLQRQSLPTLPDT